MQIEALGSHDESSAGSVFFFKKRTLFINILWDMDFPGRELLTVISCGNLFVNETVSSFFTAVSQVCASLSHVNYKLEKQKSK